MKKLFLIASMILLFSLGAFAQDRVVTYDQLPKASQDYITKYFSKEAVIHVKIDEEAYGFEYEVYLNTGAKLEFDKMGDMKKVDCNHSRVPDVILPTQVLTFITNNYPGAFVTEWCKKRTNWKAELSNGLDLYFNTQYQLIGIDD
jgi:hypothetical protein